MLPYRFPRPVRLGLYALAVAILFVLCVLPTKDPVVGESYGHDGSPRMLKTAPAPSAEETLAKGVLPFLLPVFTKDGLLPRRLARLLGSAMWMYDLTGGLRIGKLHRRVKKDAAIAHMPTLRAPNATRTGGPLIRAVCQRRPVGAGE